MVREQGPETKVKISVKASWMRKIKNEHTITIMIKHGQQNQMRNHNVKSQEGKQKPEFT